MSDWEEQDAREGQWLLAIFIAVVFWGAVIAAAWPWLGEWLMSMRG